MGQKVVAQICQHGQMVQQIESLYLSPTLPVPEDAMLYHKERKQDYLPFIEDEQRQYA